MAIIRRSDFPSLLENFFGRDLADFDNFFQRRGHVPAVNIKENDHDFEIEVAAPGLKKEDFKLNLDNNVLTISSEKEVRNEEKDQKGNYTRQEFGYQSFSRSFSLPELVDADKIKASYTDGILRIHVPKREEAKKRSPRNIDIS